VANRHFQPSGEFFQHLAEGQVLLGWRTVEPLPFLPGDPHPEMSTEFKACCALQPEHPSGSDGERSWVPVPPLRATLPPAMADKGQDLPLPASPQLRGLRGDALGQAHLEMG